MTHVEPARDPAYRYVPISEWRASDCPSPSPEVMDRLRRLLPPVQPSVDGYESPAAA